ncbi:TerC family protein [Allopusillimonas ginsengisoli]|uniref:TerC family protein n=1 Tax=Allopusillimonas ginsengisoli TaxID=453575 RepID=UPI00102151BF|nr:TerC family protein [Allopusillimonas ginsengisoli]TEA77289.1 TerC family protein [Allopusillimonas ginsengisoli]
MDVGSTQFWLALLEIIWVNILLSGDNAVVIALAARSLPANQQKTAIALGSTGAIVLRIILTIVAAQLLLLPWLKVVGGLLLLYIGVSLLLPEGDDTGNAREHGSLLAAIRTILLADLVMSLDNVVAVAAAAHGDFVLLVIGLAISIPLVIFGSTLLLKVIERLPVIVWLGAALLGYIAGEMLVSDPALVGTVNDVTHQLHTSVHHFAVAVGLAGAVIVLATGKLCRARASV